MDLCPREVNSWAGLVALAVAVVAVVVTLLVGLVRWLWGLF